MDRKLIWLTGIILTALGGPFLLGYVFFKEGTLIVLFSVFFIMPAYIAYEVLFGQLRYPVNVKIIETATGK